MRSYVNRKGEKVEVSKEHLETAVELKLKLQKDSPSNRCSWNKHKQLMIKEGFEDSENSEQYRCLIKNYQKEVGSLPSQSTFADLVATKKLESYKELVGEMQYEKQENQQYLKAIRKGKKDIIEQMLWVEEIRNVMKESLADFELKSPSYLLDNPSGTRIVALLSDWHIGSFVDIKTNKFNLDIAEDRIIEYATELIEYADYKKADTVDIAFLGDMVEHIYMHKNQQFNTEITLSKQAVEGAKLMSCLIAMIRDAGYSVTYRGIGGNHDRVNGDSKANISGDSYINIVNEFVKQFIETSELTNIEYVECDTYEASILDVNGINIKLRHGNLDSKKDTDKLFKYSQNDGVFYDIVVFGHYHHFEVIEVGKSQFEVYVGCLKGTDNWAYDNGFANSPSQAIISVDKNKRIDFKRVELFS